MVASKLSASLIRLTGHRGLSRHLSWLPGHRGLSRHLSWLSGHRRLSRHLSWLSGRAWAAARTIVVAPLADELRAVGVRALAEAVAAVRREMTFINITVRQLEHALGAVVVPIFALEGRPVLVARRTRAAAEALGPHALVVDFLCRVLGISSSSGPRALAVALVSLPLAGVTLEGIFIITGAPPLPNLPRSLIIAAVRVDLMPGSMSQVFLEVALIDIARRFV